MDPSGFPDKSSLLRDVEREKNWVDSLVRLQSLRSRYISDLEERKGPSTGSRGFC
jgi:hypothetical protein